MNLPHSLIRKAMSTIIYSFRMVFRLKGIPVLMYHRVTDDIPPGNLVVSTSNFYKQMEYLKNEGYQTLTISEFYERLSTSTGIPSGERYILLTFDDGWIDNFFHAFPVLKKFSFNATIFLICNTIENHQQFPEYLTFNQIVEMQDQSIDFGSHTLHHKELPMLDYDEVIKEISYSKMYLEKKLNTDIISFCYPRGKYNDNIISIVSEAGYDIAFTINPGRNKVGCNMLMLNRTEISGHDSIFDFKKKLSGAYDPLHKLVQKTSTI